MKTNHAASVRGCRGLEHSQPKDDTNIICLNEHSVLKVERGPAVPKGKWIESSTLGLIRRTLCSMRKGDSFVWPNDNKLLFDAARQTKIKITTRKLNGAGYRVWRVK